MVKSTRSIIKSLNLINRFFLNNTITFFNILNAALLGLVLFVGSYKNTLFILVIIINTIAGIYQEIKAKKNVRSPIYSYYLTR